MKKQHDSKARMYRRSSEQDFSNFQLRLWRLRMSYYFAKTLNLPFDRAVEKTIAALKAQGFGVLTTIDVQAVLKEKIGAEFHPYVILGACNPKMAHQALQAEDKIGTMLPCNVIVQQKDEEIEVAAIDPVASMQAVHNDELGPVATEVRVRLKTAIESL
jgi:uncharacterized protein (DUF302 family)